MDSSPIATRQTRLLKIRAVWTACCSLPIVFQLGKLRSKPTGSEEEDGGRQVMEDATEHELLEL